MACSARRPCLNPHLIASRPRARRCWREQGAGKWHLARSGAALVDQGHSTFGLPVSMMVDLAQLRPVRNLQIISTRFYPTLPQRRVILHGTMLTRRNPRDTSFMWFAR